MPRKKTAATVARRVITYNVLSSHLCSPDYFTKCTPKALDPDSRFRKLLKRLDAEMADSDPQPIFCLQEVSRPWSGKLVAWFSTRGYTYVPSLYGRRFNGYMGVAVAVPAKDYKIVECHVERISETKEWPLKPEDERLKNQKPSKKKKQEGNSSVATDKDLEKKTCWEKWWGRLFSSGPAGTDEEGAKAHGDDPLDGKNEGKATFPPTTATVQEINAREKRELSYWWEARDRHNTMICLILESVGEEKTTFCIGNYHMPCAFWSPPQMTIHAALAGQFVAKCAKSVPYILAGDFNFSPAHPQYELMTKGKLAAGDPALPVPFAYDKTGWVPELPSAFRSSYKAHHGKEPDCTNYAHIREGPTFIDTLDYVFISDGIEVAGARKIADRGLLNGPLPNKAEESDHVAVCVDLNISSVARL
jgi:hypothetical protein